MVQVVELADPGEAGFEHLEHRLALRPPRPRPGSSAGRSGTSSRARSRTCRRTAPAARRAPPCRAGRRGCAGSAGPAPARRPGYPREAARRPPPGPRTAPRSRSAGDRPASPWASGLAACSTVHRSIPCIGASPASARCAPAPRHSCLYKADRSCLYIYANHEEMRMSGSEGVTQVCATSARHLSRPGSRASARSSRARWRSATAASCMPGPRADLPGAALAGAETIDGEGRWITPGLIDCHTHLVWAGDRAHEFELRLSGASYEEVARAGGGIVSSVGRPAGRERGRPRAPDPAPARRADGRGRHHRRGEVGLLRLDLPSERKALRAARRLAELRPVTIRTTFLGAHPCRRRPAATRTPISPRSPTRCCRRSPRTASSMRSMRSARGIAFSPDQVARVFARAESLGLPGSSMPTSSRISACALAHVITRCRPITSNIPTRPGRRHGGERHRRGAAARRLLLHPRDRCAAGGLFRRHGVPMAVATDANPAPRRSPRCCSP